MPAGRSWIRGAEERCGGGGRELAEWQVGPRTAPALSAEPGLCPGHSTGSFRHTLFGWDAVVGCHHEFKIQTHRSRHSNPDLTGNPRVV